MNIMIKSSSIPEEDKTPLVIQLLEIIHQQAEEIQRLKDEIARLKGHPGRPSIRPSRLEKPRDDAQEEAPTPKRPGSANRRKTEALEIHETLLIAPDEIPKGSIFKGYTDYTVQDLQIQPHNIRYRLERWETPAGDLLGGQLPDAIKDGHFGPTLVGFIVYQYYHGHVTQPLLLEQLGEYGIDISAGQLSRILTEHKDAFHEEKDELFATGLEVSPYVQVDDTGARHQGANGYCTHIGNEWFSWFESTASKSRLNFLKLLRVGHADYVLNPDALTYMEGQGLAQKWLSGLRGQGEGERIFADDQAWAGFLETAGMVGERVRQIVTEGALLGSVIHHGLAPDVVIISDDAGQFNILQHALCWVHTERALDKIVPYTEQERQEVESLQEGLWQLYRDLKGYKEAPDDVSKVALESRFDALFSTPTSSGSLNSALQRIHRNKAELLLVLTRPEIPLHNNLSENAIRDYVKRRKISGSTRSEAGRRCRDTFTSLKKSCRKLGVSFWQYLLDRIGRKGRIPRLASLIRQRAGFTGA